MKQKLLFSAYVLFVCLFVFFTGGCRQAKPVKVDGKISVTSVIFPSYDFVRVIAKDRVNLVMLLPPGAESHSYEPSPKDIVTIKESDLFIYPGGESTRWVGRILDSINSPESKMKVLKLMDLVDTVEEETVEGMEDAEEENNSGALLSYDEHVWTSPKNARRIVEAVTDALCGLDPVNAGFFRQNAAEYAKHLDDLDAAFRSVVEGAKRKTIVFGDRFPFRYFADAYGLKYFAAFPGCSAETEPSAATVAFLINKIKSEHIPVVFYLELSNQKMADTICEATGAKKLLFHSCHNVTKKDFENGVSYLDLQRINADHLKEALW